MWCSHGRGYFFTSIQQYYSQYEVKCENCEYLKKLRNIASLPPKAYYSSEKAKYYNPNDIANGLRKTIWFIRTFSDLVWIWNCDPGALCHCFTLRFVTTLFVTTPRDSYCAVPTRHQPHLRCETGGSKPTCKSTYLRNKGQSLRGG